MIDDDIVNIVKPGDNVNVIGVGTLRQPESKKDTTLYQTFVHVSNIEKQIIPKPGIKPESDVSIGDAIGPGYDNIDEIRDAVELQLFGGLDHETYYSKIRGDIHILILGEPGVGKSTVLKSATKIAPLGNYTTIPTGGIDGLIGTVVSYGPNSLIKAGELALSSGGLIGIDDIDHLKPKDFGALYEAFEHQRITISKRGLIGDLDAKCAVLAAGIEAKFPKAFLDRFDLIFRMDSKPRESGYEPNIDEIKNYISYARTFEPKFNNNANEAIKEFKDSSWREYNKIQRLAEASARKRLSKTVKKSDVKKAIKLMEKSHIEI